MVVRTSTAVGCTAVQIRQPNLRNSVCTSWCCSRFASRCSLPQRQSCNFTCLRRPARILSVRTAAWADTSRSVASTTVADCHWKVSLLQPELHSTLHRVTRQKQWPQASSEFQQLCHTQLRLVSEILQQPGEQAGSQSLCLTLYQRDADSLEEGQLQLCQVTSLDVAGSDNLGKQQTLDKSFSLGNVGNAASAYGAEEALAQAQLVDLPHNGGLVLPLAAHGFLVGLLVIEGISAQASLPGQATATTSGPYALTGHKKDLVTLAGRVLASACAMELHSALEHAQSAVNRQRVIGLVEEVRGPLTALRTLGSILVPRLQQAQGREVDRDVVQGMLIQGDRLQELVKHLQAAIHPAEGTEVLKQLAQHESRQPGVTPKSSVKQLNGTGREMPPMLPLDQSASHKPDSRDKS